MKSSNMEESQRLLLSELGDEKPTRSSNKLSNLTSHLATFILTAAAFFFLGFRSSDRGQSGFTLVTEREHECPKPDPLLSH